MAGEANFGKLRHASMKKLMALCFALIAFGLCGFLYYFSEPNAVRAPEKHVQTPAQPINANSAPAEVTTNAEQPSVAAAPNTAALTVKSYASEPLPPSTQAGYHYIEAGNYFAALQTFEAARWLDIDALGFYGDLLSFCSLHMQNRSQLEKWVAYYRSTPSPTTESKVWVLNKRFEICANYHAPKIDSSTAATRFSALSRIKQAETGPLPAAEQRRDWFDQRVVNAKSIDTLWGLADGNFRGAIGAEYFNLDTRRGDAHGYNDSPASASLSRAQTIAIMRLRCDMTRACGPEQLDSLLLCSRYSQCRPGISVEEVWRSVASPHEFQAAQSIYQRYVRLRGG
jgi:hypothetical protein